MTENKDAALRTARQATPASASGEPAYDRELIDMMLGHLRVGQSSPWSNAAILEQQRLLRAADNRDAAGVHTASGEGQQGDDIQQLKAQATAWELVFNTLEEVAPGWAHVDSTPAMFKAQNTIRMLAQKSSHVAPQQQDGQAVAVPTQECYSCDDGDSWFDHPADEEIVGGMKVGETFELMVSHWSVRRTYVVTKVPDGANDDYEVEIAANEASGQ